MSMSDIYLTCAFCRVLHSVGMNSIEHSVADNVSLIWQVKTACSVDEMSATKFCTWKKQQSAAAETFRNILQGCLKKILIIYVLVLQLITMKVYSGFDNL